MQVIGNNIANLNTVGFKGSRSEFADVLSQSINTPAGKKQIGRGVRLERLPQTDAAVWAGDGLR